MESNNKKDYTIKFKEFEENKNLEYKININNNSELIFEYYLEISKNEKANVQFETENSTNKEVIPGSPSKKSHSAYSFIQKILGSPMKKKKPILESPEAKILQKDIMPIDIPNSKISYEIIESKISNKIYELSANSYDTFCQCVLITGLSGNNTEMIEQSCDYPSMCNHKECSMLSSFKPFVLQNYQNKNKKYFIDINDLTANLCFPLGIKLCFTNKHEPPKAYEPFMNIIKNEKGELFYMVSLHYYKKITVEEFEQKFKVNPLKEFAKYSMNCDVNVVDQDKFNKQLDILQSFIDCEYIFIPECITLVSRFPFVAQMKTCLQALVSMSPSEANELLNHLINEVPIPSQDLKIMFFIQKNITPILLECPLVPSTSTMMNIRVFDYLSIENIIEIFHLCLLEQKILFIGNNYSVLSAISFWFVNILYPFNWVNIYIPVLSLNTVKFLQSIIPFIMGIDEFLLNFSIKNEYINTNCENGNNNIVYVDIERNLIYLDPIKKKNETKKKMHKILGIPDFPEKITKKLGNKLKEIKKSNEYEEKLKEVFCKVIALMLNNYKSYLFFVENEITLFNSECFIESKSNEEKPYYKEMIQTQMFTQFINNEKERYLRKNKRRKSQNFNTINVNDSIIVDTGYFNTIIENEEKTKKAQSPIKKIANGLKRKALSGSNGVEDHIFHINLRTLGSANTNYKSSTSRGSNSNKDSSQSSINNLNDNSRILLLSPYFLKIPLISSMNFSKVEKYIQNEIEKKKNSYSSFKSKKEFAFSAIIDYQRRYIINNENQLNGKGGCLRKKSMSSGDILKSSSEDIKAITEWFTEICTAESQNRRFKLIDISELMKIPSNREYIATLIVQGEVINDQNKKILNTSNLAELTKIIRNALIHMTSHEYYIAHLLTLSFFKYYTIVNGKEFYMLDEYDKKYSKKTEISIWNEFEFWNNWLTMDIKNELANRSEVETFDSDKSQILRSNLILGIMNYMIKLNIHTERIKTIIIDNIAPKHISGHFYFELKSAFQEFAKK